MNEMTGVLVMFDANVVPEQAAHTLDTLGDLIIGWAQVFDDKPLYAVKVSVADAESWKETLRSLPGAVWSEVMLGPPSFEEVRTCH
jgi:hypothetical protein